MGLLDAAVGAFRRQLGGPKKSELIRTSLGDVLIELNVSSHRIK